MDREELKLLILDLWYLARYRSRWSHPWVKGSSSVLVWFILDHHSWSSPEERALEHGSCVLFPHDCKCQKFCDTGLCIPMQGPSGCCSHFLCFWLETEVQTSCVCNFTSLWVLFFFFVLRQCMFLGIKVSVSLSLLHFFGSVDWGTFILCSSELKFCCKMTYEIFATTDYNILCVVICLL